MHTYYQQNKEVIDKLLRIHYYLMDHPRYWYEKGLIEASSICCKTASDIRTFGDQMSKDIFFDTDEIESLAISKMVQNTTPSPEEAMTRRKIEAMVSCPKCLASTGVSCWTNGLADHPHFERVKEYLSFHFRILNLTLDLSREKMGTLFGNIKCILYGHYEIGVNKELKALSHLYANKWVKGKKVIANSLKTARRK